MLKPGYVLQTPADFAHALWHGLPVEVWQNGELIDYGGPIEKLSKIAVKINDSWYLREFCEFRVR